MAVVETDLLRRQAYVGGRWVDADSGATFPVVDPATGWRSNTQRSEESYER